MRLSAAAKRCLINTIKQLFRPCQVGALWTAQCVARPLLRNSFASAAILSAALFLPSIASASFVVTVGQQGSNVVAIGAGSINTAGLTYQYATYIDAEFFAPDAVAVLGPAPPTEIEMYSGLNGPSSFGSGATITDASSGLGPKIGVVGVLGNVILPLGYISDTPLHDSAIFDNTTLNNMGLTVGTYTWTWGNGPTADSFTLDIVPNLVTPEPASVVLLLGVAGLVGIALWRKTRRGTCLA